MALWNGLGQAATVAQLVGADVGGLISLIMQAAMTARQNWKECEQLARRVFMIAELLPHVQDPEAVRQLAGLGDTLRDAHDLVMSCQGRSAVYQLVMAGRQAERFREVQSKIDFYLILFPVISHIGITRRLDRIYNTLVQDDSARVEPSPLPQSPSQLQEVVQEILAHGTHEFTLAEIMAATNNFALDSVIGVGGFGKVYKGTLQDGREVAVKCNNDQQLWNIPQYHRECSMLSSLRHENIIRLLGCCVSKKHKSRLPWRGKEPKTEERMIVYEYMENGSLYQHLHRHQGSSSLSPVTVSWKVRIDVLLGVSRAIEHLHCHASPRIIHRDIKSSNILLDASWVPRLSDFGLSLKCPHKANEKSGLETSVIGTLGHLDPKYTMAVLTESGVKTSLMGTRGYADPEYVMSGWVKPSSDVYGLGVVMLEALSGKRPYTLSDEEEWNAKMPTSLIMLSLSIIEAGNLGELLDKRPLPEPTPGQLQALELVAQTAVCCVQLEGKDRPAISDVVANLGTTPRLGATADPLLSQSTATARVAGVRPFLSSPGEVPAATAQLIRGRPPRQNPSR